LSNQKVNTNIESSNKYTPKGSYYIPGENKNRYDKDEQGNWYIQKDDGKTWVPASSLPNSSDAIKRLNDESKMWNGTQSNKTAASASLVKPKTSTTVVPPKKGVVTNEKGVIIKDTGEGYLNNPAMRVRMSKNETVNNAKSNLNLVEKFGDTMDADNFTNQAILNNFEDYTDEAINEIYNDRVKDGNSYNGTQKMKDLYVKKLKEEKEKRANKKLPKMKKGGYIRKMVAGGPIYPMLPNPNTGIYAIDETGMAPYYELPSMVPNSMYDISPINPQNPLMPSVTNTTPANNNPSASPTTSTPNTGDTEVLDMYKNKISERKGDAVRDAEVAKTGYNALSRRVGMRDLMQLGTGLVGIGLQDRTERRAFKRPLYMDQKYRGLSAQQINQQSKGDGIEGIKHLMNSGSDRMTSRLAPILLDRIVSQQGATRKAYVDQNTQLERAKYGELGAIQQANLDEEARAKNVERDFNNKAIAGTSSLINKYISSRSAGDINDFATSRGIDQDLTSKLYALDNQGMQVDMIGKDYDMQMSEVNQKIADIEAELSNPNTNLDETAKASLKSYQESYKQIAKELEKKKIRSNINGQ